MRESLAVYVPVVWAMGASGVLLLIQLLVVDFAGLRSGHVPGTPVAPDHGVFMFRAARAHANTNESIVAFVLLSLFGMFSSANASWLNALAWAYVLGRVVHMICYYADQRLLRTASFAVSVAALFGMFVAGARPWFT